MKVPHSNMICFAFVAAAIGAVSGKECQLSVAVVGGGIGGAASAYQLRKDLGHATNIDM